MSVNWAKTKDALSTLESKLKCYVCEKLPSDPQLLWCKHSFCESCIKDRPMCPRCQFPVSPQEVVPDIMLNKLLQAMRVAAQVSKGNEEHNVDKENSILILKSKNDFPTAKNTVKNMDEKLCDSVKTRRKGNFERKDTAVVEKESNSMETDEIKIRAFRRISRSSKGNSPQKEKPELPGVIGKSSSRGNSPRKEQEFPEALRRSSSRGNLPRKEKQELPEALRRSSRSSSRGNSPRKDKLDLPEILRRSSRSISPHREKKDLTEKKHVKTKSQNSPPRALTKKNNVVMSTPKAKPATKCSTPILFSAKKVHHANKVNSKGETPLQIACRQGKLSVVQQLLREGAEPNVKDYANWTPLCDAVGSGNLAVVRTLVEAGAAVNTPANLNTTALVEAVVRKDRAMVQLLLSHGADMNQRTALNNTALSLADDEMRDVMLSCDHVSIQPPPQVPTTPRAVLVDVQLPPPQLDQVMELCRQFNLTLSTGFTEDITHVVVEKSATNTCKASTAVMLAIVNGCSVVGMDWATSCLEARKLVAVDEFEASGTDDYPTSDVFHKARLNKEQLLPRLFDGCHISLQHDQPWGQQLKLDTVSLITAAGAVYQPRQCDPERVPQGEATVMYHTAPAGPLGAVSHIILYQAGPPAHEPLLKYNMPHVKSLPLSWFHKCIQTFNVTLDSGI